MRPHTKTYYRELGFKPGEHVPCEICKGLDPEGEGRPAADVHHIDARGMGGNPAKDKERIENLMALCTEHHEEYGDRKQYKEKLRELHSAYCRTRNLIFEQW